MDVYFDAYLQQSRPIGLLLDVVGVHFDAYLQGSWPSNIVDVYFDVYLQGRGL